jgi:hypothetical protein
MNESESKFEEPRRRHRRGERSNPELPPRISMNDCDFTGQLATIIQEITGFWNHGVRQVELEFGDINEMTPNAALRLFDLLERKPAGTEIVAVAHSPIIGPGVLVWLEADRRYIRPTAWLYFRSHKKDAKRRCRPPWFDEGDWWRADEGERAPNFTEMDYGTVLRLINHFMPVKALADKVLTPALLDEFCLLGSGVTVEGNSASQPLPLPSANEAEGNMKAEGDLATDLQQIGQFGKRVWYVGRKSNGRYTLQGGLLPFMMDEDPSLREADIKVDFETKQHLLEFLKKINFCENKDKVVVDEGRIVME